jgi:hypothetical protein
LRQYLFLSLIVSLSYLLSAYLVVLVSYSRGDTPPFVAILAIYAVSLLWPFALATFSKAAIVEQADLLDATRGTSTGMFIGAVSAIPLLFSGNWSKLFQTESFVVVGLPLMFFGSALLPFFASARSIALKIIDPETRGRVLGRLSAPHYALVILALGISSGALPPRKLLLNLVSWTLILLIFPLAIGWLLLGRTVGPVAWVFPIVYYGLMLAWTRANVRKIGEQGIEVLRSAIRTAQGPRSASAAIDLFFIIFVTVLFLYLAIRVIFAPL